MVNPYLKTLLSDMNAYLYKRKYDLLSFDRCKYITVCKTGEHYDTMALKPDSGSDSCNVNKHDVILCDSGRCQLCMSDISECTCRPEAQVSMKSDQGNSGERDTKK